MGCDTKAPDGYDPRVYPPFAVTVDVVTFTIVDDQLQILLVRRGQDPYKRRWALPGGFVRDDEGLEAAALRELQEETGIVAHPQHLEQLGTYGRPDRDPRMRVVTVAYWAILANLPEPRGGGDAADAALFPVVMIEADALRLAFDHATIIREAVERVRSKLEYTTLAAEFCPPEFTISQLRRVYEAVWNARLEPANFHRKVTRTPGYLRSTGSRTDPQAGGGRPAKIYRQGGAKYISSPLTRSPRATDPELPEHTPDRSSSE
ncbi:MAG: NUDIX domain-containing protein [bacterium]|nr:NUDIX domain-containing protein [bacterium]MDE0289344.1 NUDIX domain-containing protein [bacterium]MDE0439416.1 NUDIX domain-containing protein [bacterium]